MNRAAGAPIDAFGVGTELATSADAPAVSAVYKLVELESNGEKRYIAKYSPEKQTLPGAKQVFRFESKDIIGCSGECTPGRRADGPAEALLRPVIVGGQLVEPTATAAQAREFCQTALAKIRPGTHVIEYSPQLLHLAEQHNQRFAQ